MGLPEVNRARILELQKEIATLSGDFDAYEPVITEDNIPDVIGNAPTNVRASGLFRTIMVTWAYNTALFVGEYEVYASQSAGFTPLPEHLVWSGKDSGFQFEASLNQLWYFRVRLLSIHGTPSPFSEQVSASTADVSGLEIDEQFQIDTIEYANQYTAEREVAIMASVATKLDANFYHDNIILKADVTTVDEHFALVEADVLTKASLTYVDGKLTPLTSRVSVTETNITQNTTDIGLRATKVEVNALTGRVSASETSITTNAEQIALRATKTEFDAVAQRVTNAETSITANANAITLKANQTSLTALTDRVTTAESSIVVNANAIALRVTKATYDTDINDAQNGLIARMNTAETSIVANSDEIVLKATQLELDTRMGDVVNRLDLNEASITTNANNIALRVTSTTYNAGIIDTKNYADSAVGAVVVGAKNLVLGSGTSVSTSSYLVKEYTMSQNFVAGAPYVVTLKGTKLASQTFGLWQNAGSAGRGTLVNIGNDYWQLKFTAVAPTAGQEKKFSIYQPASGTAGAVFVEWIQLEKGNKGTDWTPAPEDVYGEIDIVEARVTTAETSITANANAIVLKASQSSLDSTNSRLSTAESSITTNANNIALRVEKNGVIGSINLSAEALKINVAKLEITGDLEVLGGLVKLKNLIVDKVHIKDGAIIERMISGTVIANVVNAGTANIDFARIANVSIVNAQVANLDATKITTGLLATARVQIGTGTTFAPGFDPTTKETPAGAQTKADTAKASAETYALLNDKVINSGGYKTFLNPVAVQLSSGTAPSTLIIRTPITFGAYMCQLSLSGYVYSGGSETVDATVGFYAYNTSSWFVNTGFSTRGKTQVEYIQLASDASNKAVIIVKFKGTTIPYPKINVDKMIVGHTTPPDSWKDGWSASFSTDLTGITVRNTPSGKDYDASHDLTLLWQYADTVYIDGGNIYANTVTANEINVANLSSLSSNLGTVTAGTISGVTGDFTGSVTATSSIVATLDGVQTGIIFRPRIASSSTADEALIQANWNASTGIGLNISAQNAVNLDRLNVYADVFDASNVISAGSITVRTTGSLGFGTYGGLINMTDTTWIRSNKAIVAPTLQATSITATSTLDAEGINSSGTGGLNFDTYGGKIHMQDTSWIRFNKPIFTSSLQIRSDGNIQGGTITSTGAITTAGKEVSAIESEGTNANGTYIRYVDGTQICWMRVSTTTQTISSAYGSLFQGVRDWIFPIAFFSTPAVHCSEFSWGTGASWGTVYTVSTTQTGLRGIDVSSRATGVTTTISAMAIGRWKA